MTKRDFSKINITDYKHSTPIQIRFVDIDKMGHVNNATILSYFEIARTHFFDEVVGQQDNWFERGLIIANTNVDYLQPVYLRDNVLVYIRIAKIGTKSFDVEHVLVKTVNSNQIICAVANSIIVCMDYTKKQTIEIPAEWKEKLSESF
ncbi:MAG: thioesterase family protein [Bacteroidia bacterium]